MAKKKEKNNEQEIEDMNPEVQVEQGEEGAASSESSGSEVQELKDKYLRLLADFENYKKRTAKEVFEIRRTAAKKTISTLLPVLDDFDRAKMNAESDGTNEVFSEGVNLVYDKLYKLLGTEGLEPMESTGEDFDPELHEAITKIPAPTEEMKGKIIDTIEKGYRLNDIIIRYAKVVVGE